jgi:hypothetical protein
MEIFLQYVSVGKKLEKNLIFAGIVKPLKKERTGSGSAMLWNGPADPDPYQNASIRNIGNITIKYLNVLYIERMYQLLSVQVKYSSSVMMPLSLLLIFFCLFQDTGAHTVGTKFGSLFICDQNRYE